MKRFLLCVLFQALTISLPAKQKIEHDYTDQIVKAFCQKVLEEHGLRCFGYGGQFLGSISVVGLKFDYTGEKTIKEGRALLHLLVDDLVARFNDYEPIRPYLRNYPFTYENINIGILLSDEQGKLLPEGKFCSMSANKGDVRFHMDDDGMGLYTVFRERYDAPGIDISTKFDRARRSKPSPELSTAGREVMKTFSEALKKKYKMELCGHTENFYTEKVSSIGMIFSHPGTKTIAEVRALIHEAVDSLVALCNENEQLKPFMKPYPFTADNVDLLIVFEANPLRFWRAAKNPNSVSCKEGVVRFMTNVGRKGPKEIFVEKYQEPGVQLLKS